MDVTAEDVERIFRRARRYLVTIAGTQAYRNQMVLECNAADSPTGMNTSIRYQIIPESGEGIETTGDKDQANGKEVAAFTEARPNSIRSCRLSPGDMSTMLHTPEILRLESDWQTCNHESGKKRNSCFWLQHY